MKDGYQFIYETCWLCFAFTWQFLTSVSGKFTVNKSGRKFSSISKDHAHEPSNALIKGDGDAVGLTENEAALIRWTACGPEITCLISEFESSLNTTPCHFKHHEPTDTVQNQFKLDVDKMINVLANENVFTEANVSDLIVLCLNRLADTLVLIIVQSADELSITQFRTFFKERLITLPCTTSLLATIMRNKLSLFSFMLVVRKKHPNSLRINSLKTDCELFSRL